MEQTKAKAAADLTRQILCNSIQISESEKVLEALNRALKRVEQSESNVKEIFNRRQVQYDEYKKYKEMQLIETERVLDGLEKSLSDESGDINLYKRRVEMEKTLENLNVFCEAVHSILEPKDSSDVCLVKEAQVIYLAILLVDHLGGQSGQKMRKRRGSQKSQ
ncbi:uncharacterized protein LOC121051078 isoform X1 [Rosa chinensis]|uniref:uncharacterized protein LOC121051078 isoform X1 n=1 Tax=Rosa chinensis TaxID=74649 RepID=UPI001AD93EFB|nr:uncharacterized protein LOC121051078 isoform X1 [Rosa chinensis]